MTGKKARPQRIEVERERDVWLAVGIAASVARQMGLGDAERIRVETVVSEMAHNVLLHGGGGTIAVESTSENGRYGLRICAQDKGPGIADVAQALQDGFTTSGTLGIGLGVTKRLMDDVAIRSHPGWGTIVTVTRWIGELKA